ncbi:hypothetical protein MKY34_00535 [Sporosarcina sp. FSL K6-1522]|uniref:hypothetical protein n=1 Tax=Sporosarcina sp. FSL K6-1522 TaxID=2921554 RepID=UPI00315AC895
MNAVLTYATANDQLQRYDTIRRRNAESAYNRNVQYNGQNQKMLEKLEALLTGKDEPEVVQAKGQELRELGAGQMKQVALPIGKTLEETIDLWRGVRTEAISVPEPTTADYQLAATASAKIMQTETQIALRKLAQSEAEIAVAREQAEAAQVASMDLPSAADRQALLMQKRYERAISTYSFQVDARLNGFKMDEPNFSKVA